MFKRVLYALGKLVVLSAVFVFGACAVLACMVLYIVAEMVAPQSERSTGDNDAWK